MGVAATLGCGVAGVIWMIASFGTKRDLVLVTAAAALLAPVLVPVASSNARTPIAAAASAFLPALLVMYVRGGKARHWASATISNDLAPFAVIYLVAVVYGLVWALARGNDPATSAGQTFTAVIFAVGFFVAGPMVAERLTPRTIAVLAVVVALIAVPGIAPFASWVISPHTATFMRYLGRAALFAPLLVLLLLTRVYPTAPRMALVGSGYFAVATLLTFTRSYWIGLLAGLLLVLVAGLCLPRWRKRPVASALRSLRSWQIQIGLAFLAVAALAFIVTPLGRFALLRVGETSTTSFDPSIVVRKYELASAWASIRAHPFSGVGAGGTFASLYQIGTSNVVFGQTNFIHDAFVYFPLKFGLLGFAADVALISGVAISVVRVLRAGTRGTFHTAGFPAAFLGLCVLSITAPNLVDPHYSVLSGLLAYLAGAPRPEPSEDSN